jgi:hypothetical protein
MKALVFIFPLLFFLSACFSEWTEEKRQQFRVACEQQETIPVGIEVGLVGFEREEIRSIKIEHLRDGQIIDAFVVSPVIRRDYLELRRIIYNMEITGRTIQPRDTLRFIVAQQVFTLSDFKMGVWPKITVFEEDYDCILREFTMNGEAKKYDQVFVKPGYRDLAKESPPDSDEWRLQKVGQIIDYIDAFIAEGVDDVWYEWPAPVWEGLSILDDHYLTPETLDDTGTKLAEAKRAEEGYDGKAARLIAFEVLKTRYAMLQDKLKQKSGPVYQ